MTRIATRPESVMHFSGPAHSDRHGGRISTSQVLHLLTRQLFGYKTGWTPVPDVAAELPTEDNGGISADGRTYRIRIRRGVWWDAQQARELTAGDFIRGLKRIAYPTASVMRPYMAETILGMDQYCNAYDAAFGTGLPTAPDLAQFQAGHQVAGLRTESPWTLELTLNEPTNDILHLLASGFAAAAPREYDYYLPDSHSLYRNAPSAGPYRPLRRLSQGRRDLVLERNPRWDPTTDPVRDQPVDRIHLHADPVASGACWPFQVVGEAYALGPYLVVNMRPSRPGAALRNLAARQALAHAIDKAAVCAAAGTGYVVQRGVIPPGSPGYRALDPDPAPGDGGDPGRAADLLAQAGHAGGLTLTVAAPDTDVDRRVLDAVRAGFGRCGITLHDRWYASERYPAALNADADSWDLALVDRTPEWFGDNGRCLIAPLVRGGGQHNYGGYHDHRVDGLVNEALRAVDPTRADEWWHRLDRLLMDELPLVPMVARDCGSYPAGTSGAPRVRWTAD